MSYFTRNSLLPYINKHVVVSGRIHNVDSTTMTGYVRLCFRNPRISLYSPHRPTNQLKSLVDDVHHLWVIVPTKSYRPKGNPLYYDSTFYGVIDYYQRKNGSKDIGVKIIKSVWLDEIIPVLNEVIESKDPKIDQIRNIISMVEFLEVAKRKGKPFMTLSRKTPHNLYFEIKSAYSRVMRTFESKHNLNANSIESLVKS